MNSHGFSSQKCYDIVDHLGKSINKDDVVQLYFSCHTESEIEVNDRLGEPMLWIGIYIAIASFLCTLLMAADLLHGIRNKKFWIPCKYFSLNAASIMVITVTMKLPVDMSGEMTCYVDQAARLGSLGLMCTMMANLMPSLASMDNKTLLANLIGLSILVITMIVNIFLSIITHVPQPTSTIDQRNYEEAEYTYLNFPSMAYIYTAMILLLLVIMISSSLTVSTAKEILDSKYQATNKMSLDGQVIQHTQLSKVERLKLLVRRHWVMTETGSPQFVMASNPLSTVSGIISVFNLFMTVVTVIYSPFVVNAYTKEEFRFCQSSYKWSTAVIFIVQSIGIVVGSIAPILRCFSFFRFKLVTKWNRKIFTFFKVEIYWTQKLTPWKQSPIPFLSKSPRSRSLIYCLKNIILSFCIGFQKVIVVSCKLIWLTTIVVPMFVMICLYRWKSYTETSRANNIDDDINNCDLTINSELELSETTLKGISKSMDSFIKKASKEQNNNLLELLKKSNGFKGVEIFDSDQVQPLLPVEFANSWSLPIVTITRIIGALPTIPKDTIEKLVKSVCEGLSYIHLVEECLNSASDYVYTQKTTLILLHEVETKWKWLDNPLSKDVFSGKTVACIVRWFSDKAKQIVTQIMENIDGELANNPPHSLIAANSMYRITQTILLNYQSNLESITKKQLFAHLNVMIADIFSACFTNIPRVITMRCNESVIEKREETVKVAAKLLGKATKIIERIETLEVPSMDVEKMAYIDEWRLYLKHDVP